MKFSASLDTDTPEINLIPLIDVLLVILIFLMVTTTYSRFSELQVTLPTAESENLKDRPNEIIVLVSQDGRYSVNGHLLEGTEPPDIARELANVAQGRSDNVVIVSADAKATHQSVVNVMEAARLANLYKLSFAAQRLLSN